MVAVRRHEDDRPMPRANRIDEHLRFADVLSSGVDPLADEQPRPGEARVFHCRCQRAVNAREVHRASRQKIRSGPTDVIIRWRVKVIGVVIPSPVGVAMLWL